MNRGSALVTGVGHSEQAVIYARVSSKDQEREGFSIPAQRELLGTYGAGKAFTVIQEFIDVETAKQAGRSGFSEMIALFKRNRNCRTLLVEKTDRLYRNLKDYVTIDGLGLTIHFVKENVVLSPESRSNEKFMHGIKVLMAKNYIDNLSEETRKGMLEKARQGIWPSYAPLGYKNILGPDGKRTIAPDPNLAPAIRGLFERCATGKYALNEIAGLAQTDGMAYRKSGDPVPKSTIHKILRNRIYTGDFDFDGTTYKGTYEPIVTRELWEQVQSILSGGAQREHEPSKRASLSAASSHAATAAARWWGRSRGVATFTTTARATRGSAQSRTRGRKCWSKGSPNY